LFEKVHHELDSISKKPFAPEKTDEDLIKTAEQLKTHLFDQVRISIGMNFGIIF